MTAKKLQGMHVVSKFGTAEACALTATGGFPCHFPSNGVPGRDVVSVWSYAQLGNTRDLWIESAASFIFLVCFVSSGDDDAVHVCSKVFSCLEQPLAYILFRLSFIHLHLRPFGLDKLVCSGCAYEQVNKQSLSIPILSV